MNLCSYCCRIYVKKVRKFVDCAVDTTADKKQLKVDMDRAFQSIKDCYLDKLGHDRCDADIWIYFLLNYNTDNTNECVVFSIVTAA